MKKLILVSILLLSFTLSNAQNDNSNSSKVGWFINPEVGGIFHSDHFGITFGGAFGVKLLNDRLKVGVQFYGRPGPVNTQEYTVTPTDGQLYKGQSTITLRADHGTFGLFISPVLVNKQKFRLEIPLSVGTMGGGFYLLGDDRITPDGDRVSVWEDQLMSGQDAGFSTFYEFGSRLFLPLPNEHLSIGIGFHYTIAPNWETYADPTGDLYNNRFRLAFVFGIEG